MTPDTLIRLVDQHSERINQILDDDGDASDLLDRLEHATLTALDDLGITTPGAGRTPVVTTVPAPPLEVTFGSDPHTWVDCIPGATIASLVSWVPDGDLSRTVLADVDLTDADLTGVDLTDLDL